MHAVWQTDRTMNGDRDGIIEWVRRHARTQAFMLSIGSIALLLGGVLILVATWGITSLISFQTLGWWIGHDHWIHTKLGLFLIPLLFWGNVRTSREYLSDLKVAPGPGSDKVVVICTGDGIVSNVNPLAPETINTVTKIITDCLYVGPRTVVSSYRTMRKAVRLLRLDAESCGRVLALLLAAGGKVCFQQIAQNIDGLDPVHTFPQLRDIEGVIFLQKDPAGLSLTSRLREELAEYR